MNRELITSLAWGGGLFALALVATLALQLGLVDSDTVTRVVIGANGLMIAYFGNRMPKSVVPSACARRVQWVGGWSMVLSGLVYAGMFAFAPIPWAVAVGCGAVATGVAVTVGYSLWLREKVKAV